MRSLNLKVMIDGRFCLGHPGAEPGRTPAGTSVYTIHAIPDDVDYLDVLWRANGTLFLPGVFEADYDQCGIGRIVDSGKIREKTGPFADSAC